MTDSEREFHLKEYDSVRAEISMLLGRVENLFKYSAVAAATVFAWLLTNSMGSSATGQLCLKAPGQMVALAWLIPAVFIYCAVAIAGVNYFRLRSMEKYLGKLESELGAKDLGWEASNANRPPTLTLVTGAVWILMMLGSAYIAKMGVTMVEEGQKSGICHTQK